MKKIKKINYWLNSDMSYEDMKWWSKAIIIAGVTFCIIQVYWVIRGF